MYRPRSSWKDWQRILVTVLIGFILIAGSIAAYRYLTRTISPLPEDISSELTFSPFIIEESEKYTSESFKLTKIDENTQLLSYIVRITAGPSVTISQHSQPPQFSDIPEYKDRFLTNIAKQYATVPTSSGTIYLGRQPKNQNKQLAIMIEKGLVVYLNPDTEMNEAQWRSLGNKLRILESE
jgi:hypothetical protein